MWIRVAIVLGAVAVLTACASLSERECEAGDWYSVGLEDGAKGRLPSFFDNHVKACAKHDIVPVRDIWMQGRAEGLLTYCTPQTVYREGRSGHKLRPVCPAEDISMLSAANADGLAYWDITQDIREAEREISEINQILHDQSVNELPVDVGLILRKQMLLGRIARLKRQRRQYDYW